MRIAHPAFCFLAILSALSVSPGAGEETVSADTLRTPASPALVLTGLSPSAIERPETPKALFVSLAGVMSADREVAIDIAPYWMLFGKGLKVEDYIRPKLFQAAAQNLSASLIFEPAAESVASYGFGLRTTVGPFGDGEKLDQNALLLDIRGANAWNLALMTIEHELANQSRTVNIQAIVGKAVDDVKDAARSFVSALDEEEQEKQVGRIREILEAHRSHLLEIAAEAIQAGDVESFAKILAEEKADCEAFAKKRVIGWQALRNAQQGLSIELAAAISLSTATGELSDANADAIGAWLTFLYPVDAIDLLASLRWLRGDMQASALDNLDAGFRLLYPQDRVSIGAEGLFRWVVQEEEPRWRAALTLKYDEPSIGVFDLSAGRDYVDGSAGFDEGWFITIGLTLSGESRISLLE